MKTLSSRRRWAIDLAVCALLLYVGVEITTQHGASLGAGAGTDLDTVLIPALILPLLLRHRVPLAAAAALLAASVVSGIPTFDQFRAPVALPVALLIVYPVGRDTDRPRALGGLALVLAAMAFTALTDPVVQDEGGAVPMVAFSFVLCTALWVGGRLVRSGDELAAALTERSGRLERQREETAELAVELERTQLASELDLAARDRIREIIELADPGQSSLAADPERVRGRFARIEELSRASLNDMRGLLGVLRGDERGNRSPRPTLAQMEMLLTEARRGGRLVDLEVVGERRPLPDGVELAAYRLLQHALVAVRGADDEPARIRLDYRPRALDLEVSGFPSNGSDADVALLAARERAASQGGSFSAESSDQGRRVLRARLPMAVADG